MAEPPIPVRFEQALTELTQVLRELEDGNTSLEDALANYEKGVGLVKLCYERLRDAEQKIRQLGGIGADGQPELKPFEHTAAVEKPRPRRSRPESGETSSS